ncbi:MAG: SurA N-terminal domain-containing protein [Chloroflexota bacterium]
MAKKEPLVTPEGNGRKTRKEILIARKHERQMKRVRLAVGAVLGLLLLVIVVALVIEYVIIPNRPVAVVNEEPISLSDWQDRVRYERAQRIVFLEGQYDAFAGDVGIIQQFAGQTIQELLPNNVVPGQPDNFGQTVLDLMINETLARQAAEARGIIITDADVERELAESFNYFGGESPPPLPTSTPTVMPTPSLTPVTNEVVTETVALPTATIGPTNTPQPTPTPVTAEAYLQEFDEFLDQFRAYGISEAQYRQIVRAQLYRQRLAELLAEEQDLPTTAEHVSLYLIIYETEADANEGAALIAAEGFLPVWNAIRSAPPDPDAASSTFATELLWRTQEDLANNLGPMLANAAFELPTNMPSEILVEQFDEETTRYFVIEVSGREQRPLSEQALTTAQQQYVSTFLNTQRVGVEITDNWRGRTPTQPALDLKFIQQPTPDPQQPEVIPPLDGEQ